MLSEKIATLLIERVDFTNDELEAKVEAALNAASAATAAALDYQTSAPEDAVSGVEALVDLASELGATFPQLTKEKADKFKLLIDEIHEEPDPVLDAKAQAVFNTSVDALLAIQELVSFVENPA